MTPERWKRLEEIFHSARGQDPAGRAEYLVEACRDDEALRLQIESLLAHGEMLSELESGVRHGHSADHLAARRWSGPIASKSASMREGWASCTARWTLGSAAGRDQDRLCTVLRTLSSRSANGGGMNHVNVCTLHDIGSTPEIPGYLVMEFVEGPTLAANLKSGPMRDRRSLADCEADCRGSRSRARARHRSPRSEASERQGHASRCGQSARLRSRQGLSRDRTRA